MATASGRRDSAAARSSCAIAWVDIPVLLSRDSATSSTPLSSTAYSSRRAPTGAPSTANRNPVGSLVPSDVQTSARSNGHARSRAGRPSTRRRGDAVPLGEYIQPATLSLNCLSICPQTPDGDAVKPGSLASIPRRGPGNDSGGVIVWALGSGPGG